AAEVLPMAVPDPCPPAERLRALLDETVPADEQGELIAHVEGCAGCQRALEELAGADQALLTAAGSLRTAATVHGPHLRRALDSINSDSGLDVHCRPSNGAEWVRSLLQPAESPGALGLLGDYEVTELIGQGGMGLVLKAYDPGLKRLVAIKVLAPHLAHDDS